jgi:hypothetical protein
MCKSSLPEISPLICKLAPSRAVEPDGVVLIGRMASVLIAIPSVFAEAGFATGTGVSGGFAVVGCSVSGLLLPHIFGPPRSRTPTNETGAKPGCETLYPPVQNGDKRFAGEVFLKVTRAGSPAGDLNTTRMHCRSQQIIYAICSCPRWRAVQLEIIPAGPDDRRAPCLVGGQT